MTKELIEDRKKTHGNYRKVARVSQDLKDTLHGRCLDKTHQESLDMICVKIARIVCGDAKFIGHWADIAGYAQLIVNELTEEQKLKVGSQFRGYVPQGAVSDFNSDKFE